MSATFDPRFSDKFIKLYLNTPENRSINTLLRNIVKKIITDYAYFTDEELTWLEEYLACLISAKKIMDIPKQLNIFIYKDELPALREQFIALRRSAPPQYTLELQELQNVLDKSLNLIIRDDELQPSQKQSGYHLRKYSSRK